MSVLNACRVLLESGHVLEVYTLCRVLDAANEDVSLLLMPLAAEDEVQRERFLREFYQEEFVVPGNPMESSQKRDRVSRQGIQNALARIPGAKPVPPPVPGRCLKEAGLCKRELLAAPSMVPIRRPDLPLMPAAELLSDVLLRYQPGKTRVPVKAQAAI